MKIHDFPNVKKLIKYSFPPPSTINVWDFVASHGGVSLLKGHGRWRYRVRKTRAGFSPKLGGGWALGIAHALHTVRTVRWTRGRPAGAKRQGGDSGSRKCRHVRSLLADTAAAAADTLYSLTVADPADADMMRRERRHLPAGAHITRPPRTKRGPRDAHAQRWKGRGCSTITTHRKWGASGRPWGESLTTPRWLTAPSLRTVFPIFWTRSLRSPMA